MSELCRRCILEALWPQFLHLEIGTNNGIYLKRELQVKCAASGLGHSAGPVVGVITILFVLISLSFKTP